MVMAGAVVASNNGAEKATAMWLIGTYAVITVGELCLSPMGLSLVSTLSPPGIVAIMMGGWMLSIAIGNKRHRAFYQACGTCTTTKPSSF
ncbi:MAG: peptide MFS transporter [Bacteroidales bacterium]|nr:peptide MFS transporter [Bacteroidales bacterium]